LPQTCILCASSVYWNIPIRRFCARNGSHKKVGEEVIDLRKKQMNSLIFTSFLPQGLLTHFEIVDFKELVVLHIKNDCFSIYLDEKNKFNPHSKKSKTSLQIINLKNQAKK
jgi:hypothetical protein